MSFRDVLKKLDDQNEPPQARTNYRCAANGCPNAGCIDDHGPGTGKCYWHFQADPKEWPAVTERINANFETMRNWGQSAPAQSFGDKSSDPRGWAKALKAREEGGERLTLAQKMAWREALGLPVTGAIPTWEQNEEEWKDPALARARAEA